MEPGGGEKSWILGSEGSAARLLCHTLNDLLRKSLNVCEPRLPDGTLVAHVVIRTHRGCCGSIPLRRFSEGPSIRLVIINNFTALASGPMVAPVEAPASHPRWGRAPLGGGVPPMLVGEGESSPGFLFTSGR